MTHFISSRQGKIKHLQTFSYNFSESLTSQPEQKRKFINWLHRNPEIALHSLGNNHFSTFTKLDDGWQFEIDEVRTIEPPFQNTQAISSVLSLLCRKHYKNLYKEFLNENTFILNSLNFSPFTLLKSFQFNIEVFEDGEFFIHFFPTSKIVSERHVSPRFITRISLYNQNNSNADSMEFNLVELKHHRRKRFDLLSKDRSSEIEDYLSRHKECLATFDYHFLSNYSPDLFGTISELSQRELSNSIASMIPVASTIELPDFIELNDKPFYRVEVSKLAQANNLQVGNNFKVNQQSAAYYNGIQKPVMNGFFQPVTIDGYPLSLIDDLVARFNSGGSVQLLEPIDISSDDEINLQPFKELKNRCGSKLLFMVFTRHQLPNDFLKPLFSLRLKIQTYQEAIDNYKLSNFTVKCLEKLGGILSIIDNTNEPESTYFIGLDLGHATLADKRFSNLCMVLFDNKGRQLTYFVVKQIPLNEVVNSEVIWPAFLHFRRHIQKFNLPHSAKLIIHRDGRIHHGEIEELQKQAKKHLWTDDIDVVEIIKSGFPILAQYDSDNNNYQNPISGISWIYRHQQYAILVTNVQANEIENMVSPLVLKHPFGNSNFKKLVDQVYWFTKIYTNNLYYSTRLPATTEKANNLVGTSSKGHGATYKG